jgi:hypothetical protein
VSDPGIITLPPMLLEPINDLLTCVCAEIEAVKPVCECMILPGFEAAFYFCYECAEGKCGMAWVNLITAYPYQTFPEPIIDTRCMYPLALVAQIGAVRCMPMPDEQGTVEKTDLEEATVLQMADMWALYRAVNCCGVKSKAIGQWTSLGPDGDCVGGMWTVYLAVE